MRVFHKGWQDRRPGWRRRVRWFEQPEDGSRCLSIRLNFCDASEGEANRFYTSRAEATLDYEAFIAGAPIHAFRQ